MLSLSYRYPESAFLNFLTSTANREENRRKLLSPKIKIARLKAGSIQTRCVLMKPAPQQQQPPTASQPDARETRSGKVPTMRRPALTDSRTLYGPFTRTLRVAALRW